MGGLFIAVVMYFPNGLAGLWESHGRQWLAGLKRKPAPTVVHTPAKPAVVTAAKPDSASVNSSLEIQP